MNDDQQSKPKNRKPQVIDLTNETFEFSDHGFAIEGFTSKDGKQWFSAETVCRNLEIINVSQAVRPLPYRDKAIISIVYNGVPVRNLMVSQAGLFRLVMKSRAEKAEKYQDWVFDEVLPAIHNHGGYISPSATSEQLKMLQYQMVELQKLLGKAERRADDAEQVNYWLGVKQGAGKFLADSLPNGDRD